MMRASDGQQTNEWMVGAVPADTALVLLAGWTGMTWLTTTCNSNSDSSNSNTDDAY